MTDGLYPRMSREDYDALERTNFSTLKEMSRSPAHFRARRECDTKDTAPLRLGRALHLAALEPTRFAHEVALWDGGRRAGKTWDDFCLKNCDKEILTRDEFETCMAVQRAVLLNQAASRYMAEGVPEVTAVWTHVVKPVGGLDGYSEPCKSRMDLAGPNAIVDLKSARDASPSGFGRAVVEYKMHVQGAYYVDAYRSVTGRALPFVLIAVEKEPPFAVVVYRVSDELLEMGRETYRGWLDRLAACRRSGVWPGYSDSGEAELELPRWFLPSDETDDAESLGLSFNQ